MTSTPGNTPTEIPGPIDLLGLTSAQFVAACAEGGVKTPAALDVYRRAFREGVSGVDWARVQTTPPGNSIVEGQTTKFIQRHEDGLETESVLIPMPHRTGRFSRTLCVSSQVGCAMGCRFCETAQMGLMKNLTSAQIVGQWHAARFQLGAEIKNIVFMGMGEPMDNIEAVIQAIRVLTDHNGPGIAAGGIAVSTVGRPDGIARLGELANEPGFRKLNLAVSINAPNDAIRSSIMPINRAVPMAELMEAMRAWPMRPKGAICIEYVLIPGVNDAMEHADELCNYLRPLRCSVNVIPYNPRRESPWPAPSEESVDAFVQRVMSRGQFCKRRGTKGRSVMAACGQLGNPAIRKRRYVELSGTAP